MEDKGPGISGFFVGGCKKNPFPGYRAAGRTSIVQHTWPKFAGGGYLMCKKFTVAAVFLAVGLAAAACGGAIFPAPSKHSGFSDGKVVPDAYITAYTWFDNTPAGSPDISNPVAHKKAGGAGTYADPVTIAVGHSMETGKDILDFPAGTRIYMPDVRRYFIVEDTCGDGPTPEEGPCHSGAAEHRGASVWLDMWIGGEGEAASVAEGCMKQVTGVRTVVFDPADDYVVASGHGVIHDGECDSGYGNDLFTK